MWGRGLLPDLQRGTSENIKQPYSLGWFVLLGRTCCNKGRYCPSISGNIWKETHNCSIPTNKVLETHWVFLELIPAQTESSNLRSWVFLSTKHFIRPIWHRDLWNCNQRKMHCIFFWNLQIIEVFANEFPVFRIYSIFRDVSEATNFRFFWIVRFKNNHTCDPLFLIMYA